MPAKVGDLGSLSRIKVSDVFIVSGLRLCREKYVSCMREGFPLIRKTSCSVCGSFESPCGENVCLETLYVRKGLRTANTQENSGLPDCG
jgi:hypothetical protein